METGRGLEGDGVVLAVAASPEHSFSKPLLAEIEVLAGLGVVGDVHSGTTVKHRSRVRRDPTQPNLRQIHLLHTELFEEVARSGFTVGPGDLGENVTTRGVDLLGLPTGALLSLGGEVVVEVTGLRNPCRQIDDFRPGLLKQVVSVVDGRVVRRAGVMGVVRQGGWLRPGDAITVALPPGPHRPLDRV